MRCQSVADRFDPTKSEAEAPLAAYYGQFGDARAHAAFESQAPGAAELLRLTPAQIDRLEQTVQQAIYEDEKMINRCDWLESDSKAVLGN